jgi:hypothetical protein
LPGGLEPESNAFQQLVHLGVLRVADGDRLPGEQGVGRGQHEAAIESDEGFHRRQQRLRRLASRQPEASQTPRAAVRSGADQGAGAQRVGDRALRGRGPNALQLFATHRLVPFHPHLLRGNAQQVETSGELVALGIGKLDAGAQQLIVEHVAQWAVRETEREIGGAGKPQYPAPVPVDHERLGAMRDVIQQSQSAPHPKRDRA